MKIVILPTGDESSTGLELNISKFLLDQPGGTITVNSAPRKGNSFTLSFQL